MKVGVIGAGIGGLATAVRLAAAGHEVVVFEANATPGGKLSEFRSGPYRFDLGPSLFTMPMYVDELFSLAGRNPRDYFSYNRLPVVCRYFWDDGTKLSAYSDPTKLEEEVENVLGVPGSRLKSALRDSRKKYELTGRIFLEHSLYKWQTWLNARVGKALLRLPQLDVFSTMHGVNKRHLRHPKMVQFFDRFATYNGSNPYRAPGILNIIPHFEQGFGAFFPVNGMHHITRSIYRLACEMGVQFHFGKTVDRIIVKGKAVQGVEVEGAPHDFDRVVSNMDIFFTYQRLLSQHPQPRRILSQEKSTSALIFYWGINKSFEQLDLHNIFFSADYQNEFEHLARGEVCDDPTVYINITSKYKPDDAPAGCENWFTMINVPYNDGQNWDRIISQARGRILDKLSRNLGTDVETLIETEEILEPRSIEARTGSHLGALYGTSSNSRLAAFLRHPNRSSRISGLYFCGGSVHPGGGIPLSLLSAKIVADNFC